MKTKKMQGFLCRSHASTAVCIPAKVRPAVVPRRPDRRPVLVDLSHCRVPSSRRYSAVSASDEKRLLIPSKREMSTSAANKSSTSKVTTLPLISTYGEAFQTVDLKVSIHCQGCAGKVKKHISRMEGVTSFSIDVESKRVTVMGHISPVGVLESISRVKRAEFWNIEVSN